MTGRERPQERVPERGKVSVEGSWWVRSRVCRSGGWLAGVCREVGAAVAGWGHYGGGRHGPCTVR